MICLFSEEYNIFKWYIKQFNIFLALFRKVKWSVLHILWDFVLVAKLAMALMVFPQLLHDSPDILWG